MEKQAKFNEQVIKNNERLTATVKCIPVEKVNEETGEVEYSINYYSHPWTITKTKSSVGSTYFMLNGSITNVDGKVLRFSQRLTTSEEDTLNELKL